MDKKPPQSDYSPLELDTSGAEKRFVKVDEATGLAYEDRTMTLEQAEALNEKSARHGEPFRWRVYGTKEEAA